MSDKSPFDTSSHTELKLMQGFPPPPEKCVTRLNGLWEPPYNRWAYQNMRKIWPTAPIAPAPKGVDLARDIDPSIEQLSVDLQDGTTADFETFLHETFTDSFVVVKGGKVVYETYLNGMTAAQPHIMFSCTKSFIGLFALMAIEDGLVARETPLVSIIPELDNGGGFANATFGNVLDMTTSLQFSEYYEDPTAEIHDYVAVLGAGAKAGGKLPSPDLYSYAMEIQKNPSRLHGTVFEYQMPQADVLNWAVNRIVSADFIQTVEDRIWSKLGMTDEAYVMLDPAGNLFAGGGLNASANDVTRFAAMMLDNGRWNGEQIIPKSVIGTLSKGASTEAFLNGPSAKEDMANGQWSYCAQW
jgi:CubicO group peptidase (beta-lactamase class C family)